MQKQKQNIIQRQTPWIKIILGLCIVMSGTYFIIFHEISTPQVLPSISHKPNNPSGSGFSTTITKQESVQSGKTTEPPLCTSVNPFLSGKVDCRNAEKPKFKKPNTQWKTRTINGITYVFGEGNPTEVALTGSMNEYLRTVNPNTGNAPYGYINPQTELALKEFVSDEKLPYVLEKCSDYFDPWNKNQKPEWNRFPPNLDLDTLLIVDPETGKKEINPALINVIYPLFSVVDGPTADKNPLHSCLGNEYPYARELMEKLSITFRYYMKGGQ